MSFFKWLTPTGALVGTWKGLKKVGSWFKDSLSNIDWSGFKDGVSSLWKDYTGQTAIDKQNAANMEMAKYQAQMQEDFYNKYSSPEALMRQYQAAGLNPNLVYGSASAGQGNVPGFNAPNIERNMSGSDKMNKALSMLNGLFGLQQAKYQTDAAREIADQQSIKSLNDLVNLRRNRMDTELFGETIGWNGGSFVSRYKRGVLGRRENYVYGRLGDSLPMFEKYAGAMRTIKLNEALRAFGSNLYDYGSARDEFGALKNLEGLSPYYWTRNKQAYFNYDWDSEYKSYLKKAGIASPIIQTLIRVLGSGK